MNTTPTGPNPVLPACFDNLDYPPGSRSSISTAQISYADLIARAGRLRMCWCRECVRARAIRVCGTRPKNSVASPCSLCHRWRRAGSVYLAAQHRPYTLNELEYFITDAEPSLVVLRSSQAGGIGVDRAR